MANPAHVEILKQGVEIWNRWREDNPDVRPELRRVRFSELLGEDNTNLSGINFSRTHIEGSIIDGFNLYKANLKDANARSVAFRGVNLREANLEGAWLSGSSFCPMYTGDGTEHLNDLSNANLRGAALNGCDLEKTIMVGANLQGAVLTRCHLIQTNLEKANLADCSVYGISVWNANLNDAVQSRLIISNMDSGKDKEPMLTVDNLEVAQFIYLLLNNQKIRHVINTISSKTVLILGHFTDERKSVLEALRDVLRSQNYLPLVCNFERSDNKDFTETVRTLANMARFVLIDLTDLDDAVREIVDDVIPHCVVPIQPFLLQSSHQQEYDLFRGLQHKYRWVLAPYRSKDLPDLQTSFQERILQPINEKIIELKQRKPLKIFIGYASEDKNALDQLKIHLRPLKRAGSIELWDDQDLAPGEEKGKEIERQLSEAQIILLLISPDFLISHDCYDIQMSTAIERHSRGEARVIPILLRPCAWQSTPLKELQPLPKDSKPISKHNEDDIFFEVSEDIGDVIKILR